MSAPPKQMLVVTRSGKAVCSVDPSGSKAVIPPLMIVSTQSLVAAAESLIDALILAGGQFHGVNITPGRVGRRGPWDGQAVLLQRGERSAVVGDPDRAVGADGRAVGTAPGFGHHGLASVGRDAR